MNYCDPLFSLPAEAWARAAFEEVDSGRSANLVMLGAVVGRYGLVRPESVRAAIERMFAKKKKVIAANLAAFDKGLAFAAGTEMAA